MFSKSSARKPSSVFRTGAAHAPRLDLEVLEARENPAPVSLNDLYQLDTEVVLRVDVAHGVLANDYDSGSGFGSGSGGGSALTAFLLTNDTGGALNLNADGSFDFRPDGPHLGPVTFTYRAFNGNQFSSPATVTINQRPISGDTSVTAQFHTGVSVPAATGLLTNSTDADGNALSASVFCDPDHGTVAVNPDGSYVYTPFAGFTGVDYFSYRVFDGTAFSRPSLVTVDVLPNRAPVAVADAFSTFHNDTLTVAAPGVLANDSDVNADALTAVLASNATHGTLTLAANGSFSYRANAGYVGTDTFRYRVSDGSLLSDEVTVTIGVVDRAPVAVADTARALGGFALNAPSVLGNDTDADGDALTAQLVEGSGPAHGTLVFNPDGTYRYTSVVGYAGIDTFSYRAFDGFRFSDAATVTITVDANRAPVGVADGVSTREGFPVSFPRTRLLDNDSDPDGNPFSFVDFTRPSRGTLTLSGGTFTYTPNAGFFGTDTFTYRITDGVAVSGDIAVSITVVADNAPVAVADGYAARNDTILTVPADAGVLANDTDADGDLITAELAGGVSHGTLTPNADGSFTYVADAGYFGTDSFTYRAFDGVRFSGVATVTITVDGNRPPVAVGDSYSVDFGTTLVVDDFQNADGVLRNDTDAEGDSLSAVLVTGPTRGVVSFSSDGSFAYTPDAGFSGTDTFTYRAFDGVRSSDAAATVTVTVRANRPPVGVGDAFSFRDPSGIAIPIATLLGNDSDPDGAALDIVDFTQPATGMLTRVGDVLYYVPDSSGSGSGSGSGGVSPFDSFTYRVTDGFATSGPIVVSLSLGTFSAPVANDDAYSVGFGGILDVPAAGVLTNDTDADGDAIGATLLTGVSSGTLTFRADGSFRYEAVAGFSGDVTFTYRASDGFDGGSAATATITVRADAPPVGGPDFRTARENLPATFGIAALLANDTDPNNLPLTLAGFAEPGNGTLSLSADGLSLVYRPRENFSGPDGFFYRVTNGSQTSGLIRVDVAVLADAPPVARNDTYSNAQGRTLSAASVLGNDTDADGDTLTARLVDDVGFGTLVFFGDGSFNYDAPRTFLDSTTTSFTYLVEDGRGGSSVGTVTIDLFRNLAPTARADDYSVAEGATLVVGPSMGVLNDDSDDEGDPIVAVLVGGPSSGTLTLDPDGTFTYVAAVGGPDTVTFTYRSDDGFAFHNSIATVTISVANGASPVARPETYTVREGRTLTVPAASGVLANDSDADSASITAVLLTDVSHGTLTLRADGSFTYVSTPGFTGPGADSFTYRASDGVHFSAPQTVTLNVSADARPVAVDDAFTLRERRTITGNFLANDSDLDDPLGFPTIVTPAAHASFLFGPNGAFTYVADPFYSGTDTVTYRISDGVYSSTATIAFTIVADKTPVAVADAYSVRQGFALPVLDTAGVLANDTDADGDPLFATLRSTTAHGTLDFRSDGGFTYRPDAGYFGPDSFTYSAFDGARDSAIATVSITVVRNNAPVAVGDTLTLTESTSIPLDASTILGNDTDADGDPLRVDVVCAPQHGVVVLEFVGEDLRSVYRPFAFYSGADWFTYRAFDGIDHSSVVAVNLNISAVNNAPLAFGDYYEAGYLTPLSGTVKTFDPDGPTRTFSLLGGPANDPGFAFDIGTGAFTYTRQSENRVRDSFTYAVSDGQLSSSATVWFDYGDAEGCPKPPHIEPDAFDAYENNVLVGNVLANDTNSSFAPLLRATLLTGPTHGTLVFAGDGSFVYTPALNYFGTDTFTYRGTNDGDRSANATVTITVRPINQNPVGGADIRNATEDTPLTFSVAGLLANDTDVDGDPIAFTRVVAGPLHGTLALTAPGVYTYTPDLNYNGRDGFSYEIADGCAVSSPVFVTLNVASIDDAPVALGESFTTAEDTPLTVVRGLLGNDTDIEGTPLTAFVAVGPAHGRLTLSPDGSFVYTPDADFNGLDSFTYAASDGELLSNLVTVTIRVTPVNDAPVAVGDAFVGDEDAELAGNVLADDFDVDGDAPSASLVVGPAHGRLAFNPDGTFVYTPEANYFGPDSFTYRASDGLLDSALTTVSLTVRPVDDAPVAADDAFSLDEDEAFDFSPVDLLKNDSDIENDGLTVVEMTQPAHGTIVRNGLGFRYIPSADYNGPDSFTYRASDGQKVSGETAVRLTVRPVNDAPVARDDLFRTVRGTAFTFTADRLLANDTDIDGDPTSALGLTQPKHGRLGIDEEGLITYTPDPDFVGTDTFTYAATDGELSSGFVTVSVVVAAPPQSFAPVTTATPSVSTPAPAALVATPVSVVVEPPAPATPNATGGIAAVISLGLGSPAAVAGGPISAPENRAAAIDNATRSLGAAVASLGVPDVSRTPSGFEGFVTESQLQIPEVAERSKLLQLLSSQFDEDDNISVMTYALNADNPAVRASPALLGKPEPALSVNVTPPAAAEEVAAVPAEEVSEVTIRQAIGWTMVTAALGSLAAAVASKLGLLKLKKPF